MKKKWNSPMIFFDPVTGGDNGSETGPGSGQGTTDIEPWDWEFWQVAFDEDDSNGNNITGEWEDYVQWWKNNMATNPDFTAELFEELNGVPLP